MIYDVFYEIFRTFYQTLAKSLLFEQPTPTPD